MEGAEEGLVALCPQDRQQELYLYNASHRLELLFLPEGPKMMDMWQLLHISDDSPLSKRGQGPRAPIYSTPLTDEQQSCSVSKRGDQSPKSMSLYWDCQQGS